MTSSFVIPNIVNADALVDDDGDSTASSSASASAVDASTSAGDVGALEEVASAGVELVLVEDAGLVAVTVYEEINEFQKTNQKNERMSELRNE